MLNVIGYIGLPVRKGPKFNNSDKNKKMFIFLSANHRKFLRNVFFLHHGSLGIFFYISCMNLLEIIGAVSSIFGIFSFFKFDIGTVYPFFKKRTLFLPAEQNSVLGTSKKN